MDRWLAEWCIDNVGVLKATRFPLGFQFLLLCMNSGEGSFLSSHSPNAGLFAILWWTAVWSKWHPRLAGTAALLQYWKLNFQKDFLVPSDCWSWWNSIQATFCWGGFAFSLRDFCFIVRSKSLSDILRWTLWNTQEWRSEIHCGKSSLCGGSPLEWWKIPLLPPSAANQEEWDCEISKPGDKQCDRSLVMTWILWHQLTLSPLYFHFLLFISHISFSPQLVEAMVAWQSLGLCSFSPAHCCFILSQEGHLVSLWLCEALGDAVGKQGGSGCRLVSLFETHNLPVSGWPLCLLNAF